MSLTEPVEVGAYYLRENGSVIGPLTRNRATLHYFQGDTKGLVRQVWITHTDPAEVVAELQERSSEAQRLSAFGYGDAPSYHSGRNEAFDSAADLVAKKLGGVG